MLRLLGNFSPDAFSEYIVLESIQNDGRTHN